MVVGIDEAGRGSFVGPLVICGVELDQRGMRKLREDGVKDSKLLSIAAAVLMVNMKRALKLKIGKVHY